MGRRPGIPADQGGNFLVLAPVLYRQAQGDRHRRPYRQVPEALRALNLQDGLYRQRPRIARPLFFGALNAPPVCLAQRVYDFCPSDGQNAAVR
ncbi:conserved hypothetical protein [Xanthomonas phaseoli pv. phaseoli]|uniref:Uncharacterized protein n=1 Tax=Xanthomonas campestris pv. phaseoli TaxID=317013 RepID=A0AB38DY12_XANCH|nr:conserved hypothetical protein [Xanthomonas phaseoli pv. phaseoli]SON80716.1 conserved hypothetical protein [Xanthomonas phaseoli pv. phaseoli]SON85373.1 conserved hypothetical protein [Xanthomonas phaseoli pv. phaseoli]SOO31872.1 conserved hypothetical protein [Xanthomonas phaseoli pv. phaseoli]